MIDAIVHRKELRAKLGAAARAAGLNGRPADAAGGARVPRSRARRPRIGSAWSGCTRRSRRWATPSCAYPALHVARHQRQGQHLRLRSTPCLRAAGHRVGLYTSPHLVARQRAHPGGRRGHRRRGARHAHRSRCSSAARRATPTLTYFELGTAGGASEHFAREEVDVAVLEVGLGGRLDATTAARPRVTAITPRGASTTWSTWATRWRPSRGRRRASSAGRARRGGRAAPGGARRIIETAARAGWAHRSWSRAATSRWSGLGLAYRGPQLALDGPRARAARRATSTRTPRWPSPALTSSSARESPVGAEAIRTGLQRTRWPGRLEQVSGHPPLLLDGAHNEDGGGGAGGGARRLPYAGRPIHLVFGVVADKHVEPMLRMLLPRCASATFTPCRPRAAVHPADYLSSRGRCARWWTSPPHRRRPWPGRGSGRARTRGCSLQGRCTWWAR